MRQKTDFSLKRYFCFWISIFAVLLTFASETRLQSGWVQRNTPNAPRLYYGWRPITIYHPIENRIYVLNLDSPNQFWSWDGANWTMHQDFGGGLLYYNTRRQRITALSYNNLEFYEWDGAQWSRIAVANQQPRYGRIAYDISRDRLVLYTHGIGSLNPSTTWEWDGADWQQKFPKTVPRPREATCLSYDPNRRVTVMFGGLDYTPFGKVYLSDTWEWDGTDWTLRLSSNSPPARNRAYLTYDTKRKTTILCGGYDGSYGGGSRYDTWEWDGFDWRILNAGTFQHLPTLAEHQNAIAFDEKNATAICVRHNTGIAVWKPIEVFDFINQEPQAMSVHGRLLMRSPGQLTPVNSGTVEVLKNLIPQAAGAVLPNGTYSVALPGAAAPGSYAIKATIPFTSQIHPPLVNYRYATPDQSPRPDPHKDPIALAAGVNTGLDILIPSPVILVHGFLGGGRTWQTAEALLRDDPAKKSANGLAHRAYPSWSVSYGLLHFGKSHRENAASLSQVIANTRRAWTPYFGENVPIDLACHSLGGLITRAYLNDHAAEGSVDRVLTFGTPHLGQFFLWGQYGNPILPQALREMDPIFLILDFASQMRNFRGARFILVGSSINMWIEPEWLYPILGDEDDIIVSAWSALDAWNVLKLPQLRSYRIPVSHTQLHEDPATLSQLLDWLEKDR